MARHRVSPLPDGPVTARKLHWSHDALGMGCVRHELVRNVRSIEEKKRGEQGLWTAVSANLDGSMKKNVQLGCNKSGRC